MIKVEESLDTTSWSQYLREASKGIAESSVRNDPNLGLMVDIDPSRKGIDKAIDNILDLGFKKADEYIEEVTGDHDSDSYYVFTKGNSEDDRVVMGIVFQLDEFAFINVRYDEIEDAEYFNESLNEDSLDELSKSLDDLKTASDSRSKLNDLEAERALGWLTRKLSSTYYNGDHFEDESEISFRISPKASNRIDLLSNGDPCEHILCYGPSQNGDKKAYLVFNDDNEEIGRFNKIPLLIKFIADMLDNEDWFKGDKEGQLDSLVEEGVEGMIKVENAVSSELPSKVDNFLQDFAQAYGGIDYKDIIELGKNFSKVKEPVIKLVKELNADLREVGMDAYEASEEYDDIKEKCNKLVELIKKASVKTESQTNECSLEDLVCKLKGNGIHVVKVNGRMKHIEVPRSELEKASEITREYEKKCNLDEFTYTIACRA